VLKVLNSDGTINSKAKYGLYSQIGKSIAESAYPNPRGNIAELDVIENTVKPYLLAGGSLRNLPLTNGSSFLISCHKSGRAALQTALFAGNSGLNLNGLVLTLSVDNPVVADVSGDVVITFLGSGPSHTGVLTSQQCADQINTAMGRTIATVIYDNPANPATDRLLIASTSYGALSSLTVRAGTANAVLEVGWKEGDAQPGDHEERVEGYGFRGQDDQNNDTLTPWIEFFGGEYYLDRVASTAQVSPPSFRALAGFIDLELGTFVTGVRPDVTFTGPTPDVPLLAGDYAIADGVRVKSGEVMKVENKRFKVGTINTVLSVADSLGNYTTKVYDVQQVGTLFDTNPFAPSHMYFVANGLNAAKATAVAAEVTGQAVSPSAATAATVTSSGAGNGPFSIMGLNIHYVVTIDGVETEGTFTFTGASYADDADMGAQGAQGAMDKVAAAIGSNIPGVVAASTLPGAVGGELRLQTEKIGRLQKLWVKDDSTVVATIALPTTEASGSDTTYANLATKYLNFKFDRNPHLYQVLAPSTSLEELIDEVNQAVGATVASKSGNFMVLTSPLKGVASRVEVLDSGSNKAEDLLGLSTTPVNGTGRPFPDAYLDDANLLHIGSEILRDAVTGYPLDQSFDTGILYLQYRALRKDVSALAVDPAVIKLSDPDTLSSVLDPISEENPLALGLFLAMLNAPTYEVKGLGVDEVTAAAPEGTVAAWARAASLLEAEEVYALVPLTQDQTVHGLFRTHAVVMSAPEQGGERIVFNNKKLPDRKNSKIAVSGTSATSTASPNQFLLDTNPSSGLVALGLNPASGFEVAAGVYLELEVDGELRHYNVVGVSGSLVNLRTTFLPTQNTDGFYSDVFMDSSVSATPYSLKVRGAPLVISGSSRIDYQTMAETIAEANALIANRRDYEVFPETVKLNVGGIEKALPGYYACAAVAGMVAAQAPQQGFTNFPITGITGVVGPEKFTRRQKNIMAGGGTYILDQEVVGGSVFCRHQLSTDLLSVETRELSITKVVDFCAKILRLGIRRFIGTSNVSPDVLDMLGATVHAILRFLEETGVLNGSNINNIVQDKDNPDTVLIDVTLDVPYPCNYIRLTLVV
jgi:hypothetical protein